MPKKGRGKAKHLDPLSIPVELQIALETLYGHYEKTFDAWTQEGLRTPPCFIVVCNNTSTSKLVYDYISGFYRHNKNGAQTIVNNRLPLFRNFLLVPTFYVGMHPGRFASSVYSREKRLI